MRYSYLDWYASYARFMLVLMAVAAVLSLFWYYAGALAIGFFVGNLIESRLSYNHRKRRIEENPGWFFDKWGNDEPRD